MLAFFFLFGFLSKHLKEPVKSAAKSHYISHTLSSKSSSSNNKSTNKSSTATSTEDNKKDAKDENKDQASPSVQDLIRNNLTKKLIKMELKKSQNLLKVVEVGADQKTALMPLVEAVVEVTMQPSPQVLAEEAIAQAQLIRAMNGLTTLITILTSTHKLHQAQIQLPIPMNEITEY